MALLLVSLRLLAAFAALTACGEPSAATGEPEDGSLAPADLADAGPKDASALDMGGQLDGAAESDVPGGETSLVASTLDVAFGMVGVGGRGELTVEFRNEGEVPVRVVSFAGLASPFEAGRRPPFEIPAGEVRAAAFRFLPEVMGASAVEVIVETEPSMEVPLTLHFTGEGVLPLAVLETPTLDFGVLDLGAPMAASLRLRNGGEVGDIELLALTGLSAPFTTPQGQLPRTVAPMQTGQLLVQFESADAGDFEQQVTLRTSAGDFVVTLRARVIAQGDVAIHHILPRFAANDVPVDVRIFGGPFLSAPTRILIGDTALDSIGRVDEGELSGTLPPRTPVTRTVADVLDVRVEFEGSFGVVTDLFTITGPLADGQILSDEIIATGAIGPEGNPWRRPGGVLVPEGASLTLLAGTVLLVSDSVTFEGQLEADGTSGQIVISGAHASPVVELAGPENGTVLRNVVVVADGGEGVWVSGTPELTRLVVDVFEGPAIRVVDGGTLVLSGGYLRAEHDDTVAVVFDGPLASWFRVQSTRFVGFHFALQGLPHHFDRVLSGDNAFDLTSARPIFVQGPVTGDATLGAQPQGMGYSVGAVDVMPGQTLEISSRADLAMAGPIVVDGTLSLAAGLVADGEGRLTVRAGGILRALGTVEAPVTLGRAASPLGGFEVEVGGIFDISHLHLTLGESNADCNLLADVGPLTGLHVVYGQNPEELELAGRAEIDDLLLVEGDLVLSGPGGRLAGILDGGVVLFSQPELCPLWDLSELRRLDGTPALSVCP